MTTNKMPEVGKKYRAIKKSPFVNAGEEIEVKEISVARICGFFRTENEILFKYERELSHGLVAFRYDKENFWDFFEEIPSTSEPASEKLCLCGFSKSFCEFSPCDKKFASNSEPKEEPASAPRDKQILEFIHARLIEVHGEKANVDYMLHFARIIEEFNRVNRKEEPVKMQLSEEKKPKSIWKDVSELPNNNFAFAKQEGWGVGLIQLQDNVYRNCAGQIIANVIIDKIKVIPFSDFITQSESDHQAIAELRERLDKLEGKNT